MFFMAHLRPEDGVPEQDSMKLESLFEFAG